MNTVELKCAIRRARKKRKTLASALGITDKTLDHKVSGKSQFKASEIVALAKALGLTLEQVNEIFFDGAL